MDKLFSKFEEPIIRLVPPDAYKPKYENSMFKEMADDIKAPFEQQLKSIESIAESAKKQAESSESIAGSAKQQAFSSEEIAQSARMQAEAAKYLAEIAKTEAERAKAEAEEAKHEAKFAKIVSVLAIIAPIVWELIKMYLPTIFQTLLEHLQKS